MTVATRYDAIDLFDQVLNNVLRPRAFENNCAAPQRQTRQTVEEVRLIRMDVAETDTDYLVWAELPGVSKEDIQIEIEGKQLVLTARSAKQAASSEAPVENHSEGQNAEQAAAPVAKAPRLLLAERFTGKWTRRLQLPEEVDQDQAQAKYHEGVLELVLPKQKPRIARRLQVL